ncbi:MAG: NTP transferase domain-containing protein, partial [Paludibacteraceae bacterium]|nr:NTP transferase domain-containing protein [Paludibacteraceae bacterium]
MFSEAVILAGGFGTRLAHVLGNVPKPMGPIHGKPFLTYLLEQLEKAGVQHIILATGYKHEVIESYFGSHYRSLKVSYSEENIPLFTGGAILKASKLVENEDFLVLNGDTLFDIDLEAFCNFHTRQKASVSLALRQVDDTARYGAVQVKGEQIIAFQEKNKSKGQ